MDTFIYACGIHSIGFAVFHAFFWKIFRWKVDLKTASFTARAIIQIANLRLIYFFMAIGLICFIFPEELANTSLGHAVLLMMSLFWLGRFVEQMLFLRFNRVLLHVLSALFLLGAVLFAIPLFANR